MEPDPRKLFVGGVPRGTKEDTLREHFSKFGKVEDSLVLVDKNNGQGRGFGFVTFSHKAMADKALDHHKHVILGKEVDVKPAKPKANRDRQEENIGLSEQNNNGNGYNQLNTKKIFVGGLPPEITEDDFKNYFKSFGTITDAVVIYDKETRRPRGFGFITFDSEIAVDNVLKKTFHELNQKLVEVKRAVPKDRNTDKQFNYYNGYNTESGFGTCLPCGYNGMYPPYAPWYGTHPYHHYGWDPYVFGANPYGCLEFPYMVPSSQEFPYMVPSCQGLMPHGGQVFYPSYTGDEDYLNGRAMNNNGGDENHGRTAMMSTLNGNLDESNGSGDVKVSAITNSPQIDDSSSKSNGNTDSGNVDVPATANSPQIDNSSSSKSNGQEHQQGADGESNPSNSFCTPNCLTISSPIISDR